MDIRHSERRSCYHRLVSSDCIWDMALLRKDIDWISRHLWEDRLQLEVEIVRMIQRDHDGSSA